MAEALPNDRTPQSIMFYEASEGGTGALIQLVKDPESFHDLIRQCMRLTHHDEPSGEDVGHEHQPPCVAGCYDCLLSYTNQMHHNIIDRRRLPPIFLRWLNNGGKEDVHVQHNDRLNRLLAMCDSDLERLWINHLHEHGFNLPDYAQYSVEEAETRVDFVYIEAMMAIHIDGPHHDGEQQQRIDDQRRAELERFGWTNMVFHHSEAVQGWHEMIRFNSWLFGGGEQ